VAVCHSNYGWWKLVIPHDWLTIYMNKFTARLSWEPKPNQKLRFLWNLSKPTIYKNFETATTQPCSNSANIGECKTWMQSEFCTLRQNSIMRQQPGKCTHSVPAQEMAKHRAKFGRHPLSNVGAVTKPRYLLGCPKPAIRSQPLVGRVHYIVRTCGGGIAV